MNRRQFLGAASAASVFAGPYRRLESALQKKVKITLAHKDYRRIADVAKAHLAPGEVWWG